MSSPDDCSSNEGPREDVVDNVKFLSSALCTPVTVVLTRLSENEIGGQRTKMKRKWRQGLVYRKRYSKNVEKKATAVKVPEASGRKERRTDVGEREKLYRKTDGNKEKPSTEELKTGALVGGDAGRRLKKRKNIETVDKKLNILPRKRLKRLSDARRLKDDTANNVEISTEYRKEDCIKHILSNSKQLQVSLTKLENIKDDEQVDIWRSKLLRTKSPASSSVIETENNRRLSDALGCVALHLNDIYPNKKTHQTDSPDQSSEEHKTNSSRPSRLREVRKKSSKVHGTLRTSARLSLKLLKDPQIALTQLGGGQELSPKSSLVTNTESESTEDPSNLQLETQRISRNEEDDQDLIDEITLLTNAAQDNKESTADPGKALSVHSADASPRSSPILGKSTARQLFKSKSNLQNIQSTVGETIGEESSGGIKSGSTRLKSPAKPSRKSSKTTSVSAEDDNEKSEDVARESRLHESPDGPSSRVPVRSKSRAAGRASKKIWPKREYVTRSLSRMERHSPGRGLSYSPSPDVWIDSSKTARAPKKSAPSPRSPLKRTSSGAVADTSKIAETRSSDKESSPTSSSVISVGVDDPAVNKSPENSPSASPVRSTENNLITSSIEETRVSPSKLATRSLARPSIHSPSRPPRTPSFVSPKSPIKSSVTQTHTSNLSKQQEPEKTTSDPEIITTTGTSEVEEAPAAVEPEKESNLMLSEDEESIQLIIDDDSTKGVPNSTLTAVALPSSSSEPSTDQDQVVPMQKPAILFSRANTESNKPDEHQAGENGADIKRATSVALAQQSSISDVLNKKQKSATPNLLPTRRKKLAGRVSLGRTKPEKLKSRSKSRGTPTSKCIICDSEYKTYELLQEHLRTHSRRQSPSASGILPTDPSSDSMPDANKREQTFQDIGAAPSTCSKTACSVASSSKSNQETRPPSTEVTECAYETSDVTCTTSTQSHPDPKKPEKSPFSKSVKSKEKRYKCSNSSNACSVCCQKFESKDKLAGHIFVHTEEELQKAYEFARAAKDPDKQIESVRITLEESSLHDNVESNTSSTTVGPSNIEVHDLDTIPETTPVAQSRSDDGRKREEARTNSEKQKQARQENLTLTPSGRAAAARNTATPSKGKQSERTDVEIEVITLEDPESQNVTTENNQPMRTATDENSERDTIVGIAKPITVCECHRNDVTYGNYLRIEVSLLCHSCRTVYRSMECFEVHYRSPQNAECNKNRLHGRSPKLFCTNCGMIFSSIQDVRQHLEVHARYNTNVSTDFRCNLCKVIFVGIGSLFYIHWSNHLKNPLYIASKLSFPKNSVLAPRNKPVKPKDGSSLDEYLYVAEHICDNCKKPHSTAADLETHQETCKQETSKTASKKAVANRNNNIKVQPKIRLVCGICDQIFQNKVLFEKHAELKHKRHTEPQYICVALTTMSTVFSCSACTKMYGKLEDLETHWKTHDTKQERYMCKNCDKLYNSLESFVEHAKEYISDQSNSEVSCKVIYQESEFICKRCKLGFDSKVTMNKHFEMHGVSLAWRSAEITRQQPTDLRMGESRAVDPLQVPENPTEKTIESERVNSVVAGKQMQVEQERAPSARSDKQVSDRSEEPSNYGQEEAEASEGELVIDYREMTESDRLQKTREKPTPSSTPETFNTPPTTTGATEDLDKDCTAIAPTDEASNPANCAEKLPSHNAEPPRKGFLRVKTLAELTQDNIKTPDQCFICNTVLSSSDELVSHILATHANISAAQIAMNRSVGQGSLPNTSQPPEPRQNIASTTTIRQIHAELPNTTEPQSMLLINGSIIALGVQANPTATAQQQKPTWHTSEDRPKLANIAPKPVSGYHKNLPACPSTRPLSSATQRAPPRNPRVVAFRPKDRTSNSPILRIPQPAATGQPQQSYRTTIYPQSQQRLVSNQSTSSASNLVLTSKQSIPSTAIQLADGYSCKICPQFKGASVADYLLHELSEEHEARKRPPAPQTATVQNQPYNNYQQLVGVPTASVQTATINSGTVIQNHQPQEQLQLYTTEVYGEPLTYTPVATNQIIDYTVPSNAFVNATSISQAAPLNTQILIATPSPRTVYQPLIFNNSSGMAVMNNGTCYFCAAPFASDNILRMHINVKHPYACILCRKDFTSPQELQAHKICHRLTWG